MILWFSKVHYLFFSVAEKQCESPHDNIQPVIEKGTESDARVTQTIIMKKKNLHEEFAETVILEFIKELV